MNQRSLGCDQHQCSAASQVFFDSRTQSFSAAHLAVVDKAPVAKSLESDYEGVRVDASIAPTVGNKHIVAKKSIREEKQSSASEAGNAAPNSALRTW